MMTIEEERCRAKLLKFTITQSNQGNLGFRNKVIEICVAVTGFHRDYTEKIQNYRPLTTFYDFSYQEKL